MCNKWRLYNVKTKKGENMALLTLKDIGKIYVSDGNVSVGIRGVNLSFDRGEFVAVTGKSGSGKSTLLNVISGMDTYEEGELYIEGEPTSHYLQSDWEEYRQKYISFIFQDYNIIDSFTVLQNVELALMHIEDKKQRRARALELIDRVGLRSHVKQKGSKLSGGQKQRTVIARALAKDSPIILADEPTGNLDSETSKEIIKLLREVSADKLLIVVTHNFEQVEGEATRHIRIFDGAVESDHILRSTEAKASEKPQLAKKRSVKKEIRDGLTLGRTIFSAKPKLSAFLCMLMIIGTLGIFFVTSFCGGAADIFKKNYMFTHIDGRVVVTSQNGEVIGEDTVKELASKYGARDYLLYDSLLDAENMSMLGVQQEMGERYYRVQYTYNEDFGDNIVGSYPKDINEVLLYIPIGLQETFGKDTLATDSVSIGNMTFRVSGVKYYYDNNLTPKCLFTRDGFATATSIFYLTNMGDRNMWLDVSSPSGHSSYRVELYNLIPSFDMDGEKVYIRSSEFDALSKNLNIKNAKVTLNFSSSYQNYDYYRGTEPKTYVFNKTLDQTYFTDRAPSDVKSYITDAVYMSAPLVREIAEEALSKSYKQFSLFFEDDAAAEAAAVNLKADGYIAVPSNTTYDMGAEEAIITMLSSLMMAFMWFIAILFLSFFINLCSSRTLSAFKGEMAIMRSMGIAVKTIRIGMYVRMLLSLIPAFVLMAVSAFVIFTTPKLNGFFTYLYAWQYAVIAVGMLILTVRITHKQIKKLFGQSVKKSLRGGNAE